MRRLFYKEADCFILCYDVSNRISFKNIQQKWVPELKTIERWPIPVILVGTKRNLILIKICYKRIFYFFYFVATKKDLRQNSRKPLVSTEEGEDLCRIIRANRFIECSAKENIQIENTIHEAVRAAVKGPVVFEDETEKRKTLICSCCQS